MRYELKSIPLWPVVKVFFPINFIAGFVFGLLLAFISTGFISFYNEVLQVSNPGYDVELVPSKMLIILVPLLMAFSNAIFTTTFIVIITFFYNIFVKFTGGVELNLYEISLKEENNTENKHQLNKRKYIDDSAPPPPPSVISNDEKSNTENILENPPDKDIQ